MSGKALTSVVALACTATLVSACEVPASTSGAQVAQGTASAPTSVASRASEPSAASSGKLEVTKIGFGVDKKAPEPRFAQLVAVIKNGTDNITSMTVSFAAYDASGDVIGQQETSAPVARAGATVATTVPVELPKGATVAKVTADINVLQAQKDDHPESQFIASKLRLRSGEFGDDRVTGTVTSQYSSDVKDAYVAAVCYDAEGAIVAGGEDYFTVASGKSAAVQVDLNWNQKPKRCELYPTLGGASEATS
jgi:hypothetical protein